MLTAILPGPDDPVIGRFYRVPCALVSRSGLTRNPIWMPVMGPSHADPELSVPEAHYHADLRFWGSRLFPRPNGWPIEKLLVHVIEARDVIRGPELRRVKCHRSMPVLTVWDGAIQMIVDKVESRVLGAVIDWGCPVCPHRGMPLAGLPVNEDGTITCPGHQLKWCVRTGRLVSRLSEIQEP